MFSRDEYGVWLGQIFLHDRRDAEPRYQLGPIRFTANAGLPRD